MSSLLWASLSMFMVGFAVICGIVAHDKNIDEANLKDYEKQLHIKTIERQNRGQHDKR